MPTALALRNVHKRFGKTVALNGVSLDVPSGVVCAVLGANGAGKTTAIRILLGLEPPDSGEAEVLGMPSRTHSIEIRQRVGYVAEKPPLYEWMTVEEIGWFAAGFYPTGYQATYSKFLQRFALDPTQKIKNLSKGMRSKVALSLSLSHTPELLILDEPTSGLDPLVRREFLESMVDTASEGRTVLLCSHQVAEVERVADLVAILINGQLVAFERLEDLKRHTQEVVITLPTLEAKPPQLPGKVVAYAPFGADHLFMVRDLDEIALGAACKEIGTYRIRKPNLEDILLAMLRESRRPGEQSSVRDNATSAAK
ncbi:MAG: ABC transporter ATP-binding protein [Planctomycetaceae bacterium]